VPAPALPQLGTGQRNSKSSRAALAGWQQQRVCLAMGFGWHLQDLVTALQVLLLLLLVVVVAC
jgi:hypothetical protein